MIINSDHQQPVSAIIVNYNAGNLLSECVAAAHKQIQQMIIVDNASTDSSLLEIENRFPDMRNLLIIRLASNIGFSAGCNTGLKASTQPYVLFLNPDCVLQENSLQRMVQVMESDPQIGMVGGYLTNPDGTEQGGGRRAIPTPWRAFVRSFGLYRLEKYGPKLFFDFHLHRQPLPDKPIDVEAISGALMLVRREAIDDVGFWDENYFLHCEDLDWCMRFKLKNWKIVFVPDAPVTHFQGTCSRARPFFVSWHKHKGMLRFYRKFFYAKYPAILMGLIALGIGLRFAVSLLLHTLQYCYQRLKFKT